MLEKMLMSKVEEQEAIIEDLRQRLANAKKKEKELKKKNKSVPLTQYDEAYYYEQSEINYLNGVINRL